MAETLFDLPDHYDRMLAQGLKLSGEGKEYFAAGRVAHVHASLRASARIQSILDFGCGIGDTSKLLSGAFGGARVLGVDPAGETVRHAMARHGGERVQFLSLNEFSGEGTFDLAYVNGVFHHVPLEQRGDVLELLRSALRPGGILAFFENNPWNPGTRLVMRRIPFDRDAIPLSPREARGLLLAGGFKSGKTRYLFFFPRALRWLRWSEKRLSRVPLGAQYAILAVK